MTAPQPARPASDWAAVAKLEDAVTICTPLWVAADMVHAAGRADSEAYTSRQLGRGRRVSNGSATRGRAACVS